MFVVKTDATAFSCPCFHRAVNVSEMSKKEEVPEKNLELREIQQDEASGILFADWNHPPPARIPVSTRIMNQFLIRESRTKPSFSDWHPAWGVNRKPKH